MKMATIWNTTDREWNMIRLEADHVVLGAGGPVTVADDGERAAAALVRKVFDQQEQWAVIVGPGERVRVNGDRATLGIRALFSRDAIQIDGGKPMYFSTETPPVAAVYQGKAPIPCARCNSEIRPGQLAVRCKCGASMHFEIELPCWTYAAVCLCGQSTDLNDENCWRPDEI
jgi:hypothetical protein